MLEKNWKIENWNKEKWPHRLSHINDPPKKLRFIGDISKLDLEDQKIICIVGSRKYTDYGESSVHKIISGLTGYPISIVSGLAFGIDSLVHKNTIEYGLHTIAIPGSGLNKDSLYPRTHTSLANEIIEAGGCLISEFPDNFKAVNWGFPKRNRIMVGLSELVIIVEAQNKSGSMITARLATDYNRDVGAIPGSIFNLNSEGPLELIKDGAFPITSSKDILNILNLNINTQHNNIQNHLFLNLNEQEKIVYQHIENNDDINYLHTKIPISIQALNAIITSLEIKNLIQIIDNKICKK